MKKILIIDDDRSLNLMLCIMLEQAGYQTCSAEDGEAGVRIFRKESPDLVVTDIYMPEKEGLQTIMELRAIDPGVMILGISGGIRQMELSEMFSLARTFGANAMLAKPFDFSTFIGTVRQLLGNEA